MTPDPPPSVEAHFSGRPALIREIYDALLLTTRNFGPVEEDPKKTSIHLNRKSAFAAVRSRRAYLLLTLKSDAPLGSERVLKSEHLSANRWYSEIRLSSPADLDSELIGWLGNAYDLSA